MLAKVALERLRQELAALLADRSRLQREALNYYY